jgi:serine/threonine protein kinase
MEYLPGGNLSQRLQTEGRPSDKQLQLILADIVDAVAHLHQYGIAHRDLKCEKIMFDSNDRVRLIDFKYTVFIAEIDPDERYCGTFALLAPEIFLSNSISFANDWWAVGQIAFYTKFGILAFNSASLSRIKSMIFNTDPIIRKSTPPKLSSFIRGLLAKDPTIRIGSPENDPKSHEYFEDFDWTSLRCDSEGQSHGRDDGFELPEGSAVLFDSIWMESCW